jgi:copper chaperone CopZ
MKTKNLSVSGMSCQHCVMTLRKQLLKLDIKVNDVQIGSAQIEYDERKITESQIEEAVKEAGFSINTLTDD